MEKTSSLNNNLITFGIPLSLFVLLVFIMKSPFIYAHNFLHLAVTIDLLLIVPIVYFLLIRKKDIPNTTVIPVMIVGFLIGSYFLPTESQNYLRFFQTWALPFIELSVLIYIIIKIKAARKKFKTIKGSTPDFFSALKSVCYDLLPKKLVMPFATEVAVIYYGFFNWKKYGLKENEFTYHRKSGTPALMGAFIMIIVTETVALHFLLAHWNTIVAWILLF